MAYKGNEKRKFEFNMCYRVPAFYDGDSCSGCDCEDMCYKSFLKHLTDEKEEI